MDCLYITPLIGGNIHWHFSPHRAFDIEEGVKIVFNVSKDSQRREAFNSIIRLVDQNGLSWIKYRYNKWNIDLDKLKEEYEPFREIDWLCGNVIVEPEYEHKEKIVFGKAEHEVSVAFYITQDILGAVDMNLNIPIAIQDSLAKFKLEYPYSNKVVFIIMEFGQTKFHDEIVSSIKETLLDFGLTGVRADEKQYHDDLYYNILTYMYGSGCGIGIFERIESETFNPNVSLEIGYMLALNKPVCLLRDKTLKALHTDLIGKLYKSFDIQDIEKTVKKELSSWLLDRGYIRKESI